MSLRIRSNQYSVVSGILSYVINPSWLLLQIEFGHREMWVGVKL